MHTLHLPALLAAVCTTGPALADVLVVDAAAGPGSDFTTIQAAVDAGSDGDTILVRPGTYDGFTVQGKGLAVLAEYKERFHLSELALVSVTDLSADQGFVVRGAADVGGPFGYSGSKWTFAQCDSTIWIEDCQLDDEVSSSLLGSKVLATDVNRLVVLRSELRGGNGASTFGSGTPGFAGLRAESCNRVVVFESRLVGGAAGSPTGTSATTTNDGGAGLYAIECGPVYLAESTFEGGDGGSNWSESCPGGGDGGSAVKVFGAFSQPGSAGPTTIVECVFEPGEGGENYDSNCPPDQGAEGAEIDDPLDVVTQLSGNHRALFAASPAREGGVLRFWFVGEPGDLALIVFGSGALALPVPGVGGVLLLDPNPVLWTAGTLTSEELVLPVTVPDLPPGLDSAALRAQGLFVTPSLGLVLGSASHVTLLDEAY